MFCPLHFTLQVHGSLHFGAAWPGNARLSGNVTLEAGSLADDFHIYALEWEADQASRRVVMAALAGPDVLAVALEVGSLPDIATCPATCKCAVLAWKAERVGCPDGDCHQRQACRHVLGVRLLLRLGWVQFMLQPLLLQMRWYLDDYNFFTARPASASGDGQGWWTAGEGAGPSSPFDIPFFLVRVGNAAACSWLLLCRWVKWSG